MSSDQLLQHLLNTLSEDNALRTNSERFLNESTDQQPQSLLNLLDIATDGSVPAQIRLVAATYAKNKIKASWFIVGATNEYLKVQEISQPVKEQIKTKLIESLLKVSPFDNQPLFKQLLNCIQTVLRLDHTWDEGLYNASQSLLDPNSVDKLYVSLSLVYQLAKKHCFDNDRQLIDTIAADQFPVYEQMLGSNLASAQQDPHTAAMFYLILKIYKFCTFSQLPKYLVTDLKKLDQWVDYQLNLIKMDSTNNQMLQKCQKWCFANLYRLKKRHSKENNPLLDENTVNVLIEQFIPKILQTYLTLPQNHPLTDMCHYYLVTFLSECIRSDSIYQKYIRSNVKPILQHVIVPKLSTTQGKIDTFDEDPIEYIRRYLDSALAGLSVDFKNPETASNAFVYWLCRLRFQDVAQDIFATVQDIFQSKDTSKAEAGLKILNNSWPYMVKVNPEMDQAFRFFVLPALQDTNHKWLQSIACETVADINHEFKDMSLLDETSMTVSKLVETSQEDVPLQLESINALNTLNNLPPVRQRTSATVTQVMQLLLEMNTEYELDLISVLMDDFVLKFAKELEPFARQLAENLNNQFLAGAQELLAAIDGGSGTGGDDYEKEQQLSQLLRTLTTMVLSMNSQREITSNLVQTFKPSVDFVLDNAMVSFLTEVMDLLETTNFVLKQMTPETWSIYSSVLDSFENYGYEYFDNYGPYFQTVVNYGFKDVPIDTDPHVQRLLTLLLDFYKNADGDEEMQEFAFDLLMLIVLNCTNLNAIIDPLLKPIFESLPTLSSDVVRSYLRLIIALLMKRPDLAPRLAGNSIQALQQFIGTWFEQSDEDLTTVFDLKLQILALMSLIRANVPGIDRDLLLGKLLSLVEKLPPAIEKRIQLMKLENEGKLDDIEFGEEPEFDIDDNEYAELNVDTPLDNVNIGDEFKSFISQTGIQLPQQQQQMLASLIN